MLTLAEEILKFRGKHLYLEYDPSEPDPNYIEEGRGQLGEILRIAPSFIELRPFAYVESAVFGDGSVVEASPFYIIQLINLATGTDPNHPEVLARLRDFNLREARISQTPLDLTIKLLGQVPVSKRNIAQIKANFTDRDLTIDGLLEGLNPESPDGN